MQNLNKEPPRYVTRLGNTHRICILPFPVNSLRLNYSHLSVPINRLSHGQRQRCRIAQPSPLLLRAVHFRFLSYLDNLRRLYILAFVLLYPYSH
ncbi:hypothetical protein BT69DRAFT_1284644 [Atractiella rhizophila]|nr:hypothetical protein BT69DRAFT_1284644 [Atractiella rhizophila]